jgi:ubiquinone/menaquinone biosynthesis C-methylase UbiE
MKKENQKNLNIKPTPKVHRKGNRPPVVPAAVPYKKIDKSTSWGKEAVWYDKMLEEKEDTYQSKVILPNLIRILDPKPDQVIVELGCGQGFFSRIIAKSGARVLGVDISKELIAIANKRSDEENISTRNIAFYTGSADGASMIADRSADSLIIILAIQNMKNLAGVVGEIKRILKPNGKAIFVMNHPAFRVLKNSDWGFDDSTKTQYRKVSKYLSQFEVDIDMHPGERNKDKSSITKSFHRSLQDYMKAFAKEGFAITRLEEWISHKQSERGPRQIPEDVARKEIPMFMCIELKCIRY